MSSDVIVIAGKDPIASHGGFESFIRSYGRAAKAAGYTPHIFCVSGRTEVEELEFGTVHRQWSPFRPFRTLMVMLHEPFVVQGALEYLRGSRGHILVHSLAQWSGPGDALARELKRRGLYAVHLTTPFTTYYHETAAKVEGLRTGAPWLIRLWFRLEMLWVQMTVNPSERRGFRNAVQILPTYDSVRQIVNREFGPGLHFGKITYASESAFLREKTPRAPVPEPLAELGNADVPLIVAVSRHDPRKGLDVLLRSLAQLKDSGVAFRACLVGGGDLLNHHRALHKKLQLGSTTVLTGAVPDSFAYLEHADIFVLPSIEEGSGSLSLLEAMQARLAPVVSNVDGLPEDVTEGESGLLVKPGNVDDLTRQLQRVLVDLDLRRRIAKGARETFERRFSSTAFSADLRRVFTQFGFEPSSDT